MNINIWQQYREVLNELRSCERSITEAHRIMHKGSSSVPAIDWWANREWLVLNERVLTLRSMINRLTNSALEELLPPVPAGHFIVPCKDPEGGCVGWHCYRYDSGPTGEFYCNGGDGSTTRDWLRGTLHAWDSLAENR